MPFGGVMRKLILPFIFLTFFALSGYSSADEIDDIINNAKKEGKAVMLELGSVGCAPCEQMKPVMQKLRENYKGKLEVLFVDVKKDKETARKFNVFAIPTQVFLDKKGKEFHRHIGFYSYEDIAPFLMKAGF